MGKDKEQIAFRVTPQMKREIDLIMDVDGSRTRNEFLEHAVKFYKITRKMFEYILLDKAYFYDLHIQIAAACVTRLLYHLSRIIRDSTEQMSHGSGFGIDRKRWRELMEKRIAMGHKPDDHEDMQMQWFSM